MSILFDLKAALAEYLLSQKNGYFPRDTQISEILDIFKSLKIHDEQTFGFFKWGDTGLKRAKFLLNKINEWEDKKLGEKTILHKICMIYTNQQEPPKGLGNSRYLREFLALHLSTICRVTRESVTPVEYQEKHEQLIVYDHFMDAEFRIEPTPDKVYRSLIIEKTVSLIKEIAAMITNMYIFKKTVMTGKGTDPKSGIGVYANSNIFDPHVLGIVEDMVVPKLNR